MNSAIPEQSQSNPVPPRVELMKLMIGNWISQSVYAAAKLNVVDALLDGPMDIPTLALKLDVQALELRRLLRALESVGLFRNLGNDRYAVTEVGRFLAEDRPDSLRPLALFNGEALYCAWGQLPHAVKTGKSAFSRAHGAEVFEFLEANAETGAQFDSVMATTHGAEAPGVVDSYDFSRFETVIDVGGGKGSFVAEILEKNPSTRGIVFDLPHVIRRAKEYLDERGLSNRCDTISGNFFDGVPAGGDAYLLRHVIHDWRDPEAGEILQQCRAAMGGDAKLFIVEAVIPEGPEWSSSKMLDLNMLVICAGQERTAAEFGSLLAKNGFRMEAVHITKSPRVSLIEASVVNKGAGHGR